ncbi:iron-containing alcohol dehydrogenase [Microbispora sp. RL4-1S]|uniref:Iron-containing alcohol dehydrogenase n=1 Tax=Microbispora oryzae TaxID=2806554 RepID=A0A940WRM2_9ACTN|nr:daptide-type RiPP biosynthesis dehydogenase [Microbispora oryzae]MBP2708352.1 iron-containing alcohol dehydrogenase [Microbispora oryzae]
MSAQSLGRYRPTQVIYGSDGLTGWLTERCRQRVTLLVDAGVAEAPIVTRIRQGIAWAGRASELVVLSGPGDLDSVSELAGHLENAEAVVAVGGGSLLDQAKLAVLLKSDPTLRTRLTMRHRNGLVLLPPSSEPLVPLAAVPTTVGTGSELSSAVCLASARGKRLILGSGLQPELAILDPLSTKTLPGDLLAEGALEILFRLAGMYVGDHTDLPTEDAFAETLLRRLVRLGNELADTLAAGGRAGGALRLEIAKLSGLSHNPWINHSRDPNACKGWYLANELSSGLGLRKMTAAAALLPHLWAAISAPDPRWGSARRLDRLWEAIWTAEAGRFPRNPVDGVAFLIDSWQVDRRISADPARIAEITRATVRAWSAGLPTLGTLTSTDIEDLLMRSVSPEILTAR